MVSWGEYYKGELAPEQFIAHLFGHREFLSEIAKEKGSGAGLRVLEVGSGTGSLSIFLSTLGFRVTSVDNNREILERASRHARRFGGKVDFVFGEAFSLPFQEKSFDFVFHQGLLEHFSDEDIRKLLAEQLRVAPLVFLSVPNSFYPVRDFGDERLLNRKKWERVLSPYHLFLSRYYFSRFFPRWYLPRAPIFYMAKLGRK